LHTTPRSTFVTQRLVTTLRFPTHVTPTFFFYVAFVCVVDSTHRTPRSRYHITYTRAPRHAHAFYAHFSRLRTRFFCHYTPCSYTHTHTPTCTVTRCYTTAVHTYVVDSPPPTRSYRFPTFPIGCGCAPHHTTTLPTTHRFYSLRLVVVRLHCVGYLPCYPTTTTYTPSARLFAHAPPAFTCYATHLRLPAHLPALPTTCYCLHLHTHAHAHCRTAHAPPLLCRTAFFCVSRISAPRTLHTATTPHYTHRTRLPHCMDGIFHTYVRIPFHTFSALLRWVWVVVGSRFPCRLVHWVTTARAAAHDTHTPPHTATYTCTPLRSHTVTFSYS